MLGLAVRPGDARADDWPAFDHVAGFDPELGFPIGAAIRNWGPLDQVFIGWDMHLPMAPFGDTEDNAMFQGFTCSDNNGCATATAGPQIGMGDTTFYNGALHPSLAIRRLPVVGSTRLDLTLVMRQHAGDCDGDADDIFDNENLTFPEQKGLALYAFGFDTVNGHDPVADRRIADMGAPNVCEDHGFSRTRFFSPPPGGSDPVTITCFTFDTNPTVVGGLSQNVACNDDSVMLGPAWNHHVDLSNVALNGNLANEDHPGFDLFNVRQPPPGAPAGTAPKFDTMVLGHLKSQVGHEIKAHHLADDTGGVETEAVLDSGVGEMTNPDVVAGNGKLHAVWQRGVGDTAGIAYAVCDEGAVRADATVNDCSRVTDWVVSQAIAPGTTDPFGNLIARGAKFAQLAVDGKNQFFVYQADDDPDPNGVKNRVRVASRCEGDPTWNVELVRTPPNPAHDQAVVFGRPSIVVNADEDIVHVVLVEFDDYRNNFKCDLASTSDLDWYRKEYTPCP